MIQDLGNHVFHNEYQPVPPTEKDYILHYQNHEVLANTAKGTLSFPTFWDAKSTAGDLQKLYLSVFHR